MVRWLAIGSALLMVACGGSSAGVRATPPSSHAEPVASGSSPPQSPAGLRSATPAASESPRLGAPMLTCTGPAGGQTLLLTRMYDQQPRLAIFQISDPLHPTQLCTLVPASGGRFLIGATVSPTVAFFAGTQLGLADLSSGKVSITSNLREAPSDGTFAPDGSAFAYRLGDDTNGSSVYMHVGSSDQKLYARPPLGGHGGPPWGPQSQLVFSPDGRYLLAYDLFTSTADTLERLQVFDAQGILVFKSARAEFGVWAPSGHKLYFLDSDQLGGIAGDIHAWDPVTGETTVARQIPSYFWPAMAPDGSIIAYTAYDNSGMPHLWRLNLTYGSADQLSSASSSKPVFVGSLSVWSDVEDPCECGPGGRSAPNGTVSDHQIGLQTDTAVSYPNPGPGGDPMRMVLDVWLASYVGS